MSQKIINGKNADYFDFYIGTETVEHRIMTFNTDIHNKILNMMQTGVIVTKIVKSGPDYIFKDQSNIQEKQPTFDFVEAYDVPPTSLKFAVESLMLYSRITIKVKVISFDTPGMSKDGLEFQSIDVIDASSPQPKKLTLYGDLITNVTLNRCYTFTHITVSTYNNKRILKSSERSTVTIVEDDIGLPLEEQVTIIGTVESVTMSTMQKQYCCPHCKCQLETDGSIMAFCNSCDIAISQSSLISKDMISFTLKGADQLIRNMKSSFRMVEDLVNCPIADRQIFLSKFIDMKVKLVHPK